MLGHSEWNLAKRINMQCKQLSLSVLILYIQYGMFHNHNGTVIDVDVHSDAVY